MNIKIKQHKGAGDIIVAVHDLRWTSYYENEHKVLRITGYTIGKKYETIAEELALFFKEMDSKGRMKF